MALSVASRIFQTLEQSVHQQTSVCMGAYSVRWRIMHVKKEWLEKDKKDKSWMEPMLEYRREVEQAEPQEPAMLHVVRRTKPLCGRPWWEKKIMERLRLDVDRDTPVIHKNTPKINRFLKDVKHLIEVRPLRFPHGFPDDPEDYKHTILRRNGELIVKKTLEPVSVEDAEAEGEEVPGKKWRLDRETIQRDLRRKMRDFTVHTEFHPTYHSYSRNQDGKEYRYNYNKPGKYERPRKGPYGA